jgi:hypothetical protein
MQESASRCKRGSALSNCAQLHKLSGFLKLLRITARLKNVCLGQAIKGAGHPQAESVKPRDLCVREKVTKTAKVNQLLNSSEETNRLDFSFHVYLRVGERAADGLQFDLCSHGIHVEPPVLLAMQIREGCHVPRLGAKVSQPYKRKSQ